MRKAALGPLSAFLGLEFDKAQVGCNSAGKGMHDRSGAIRILLASMAGIGRSNSKRRNP